MRKALPSVALVVAAIACDRVPPERGTGAVGGQTGPTGVSNFGNGGAAGAEPSVSTGAGASGGAGGALGDPDVYRTTDVNEVCGPTPAQACTLDDMVWVASEYGSGFVRADDLGGTSVVYRLVAFVEREGPSNLDVLVVDEFGAPLFDVPVAFYYPSAPEPSNADEWFPVKVTAFTEADGIAGFALASSAYLPACGAGGPHAVWVSEPGAIAGTTVPSDLADALGMLGGTNHRHLDLIFQRVPPGIDPAGASRCPLQ